MVLINEKIWCHEQRSLRVFMEAVNGLSLTPQMREEFDRF